MSTHTPGTAGGMAFRSPFPTAASRPAPWAADERTVSTLQKYATLAGRLLLSQIFLISGVMKIVDWSGTEARMAEQGMFWIPFFLAAATVIELGAGLALLAGLGTRWAALLLVLYLIPVTFTFHHFWSYPSDKQEVQTLFFLHNWALMGGLLYVAACGGGAASLDRWRRRTP